MVDEENERVGMWSGGREWKVFLYAKRTFFSLVVVMVKEVEGTRRGHGLFYTIMHVIEHKRRIAITWFVSWRAGPIKFRSTLDQSL